MNGTGGFVVTLVVLTGMLVLAVRWPWPDVMREPAGQPWTPWCRDCALSDGPACPEHQPGSAEDMSPEDWDALETLLADKDSLAEAAEQEARQTVNGCYIPLTDDEGTTDEHEH